MAVKDPADTDPRARTVDRDGQKLVIPVTRVGWTSFLIGITGAIPDTPAAKEKVRAIVERALQNEGVAVHGMVAQYGAKARGGSDGDG